MAPTTKSNSVPTPESVHDVWLSQRTELERDLFDGWVTDVNPVPTIVSRQDRAESVKVPSNDAVCKTSEVDKVSPNPSANQAEVNRARHVERLKQSDKAVVPQRAEHHQRVTETLSQQREAFFLDLAKQRATIEQEFATRDAAWTIQRNQEWASLRQAKEIHDAAQKRLKEELAAQRVHEREELLQWRQQAEAELAEARRLFEQERLKQQQEFSRQRETELNQIRREREELDARVRLVQSELAHIRQRQEDDLRKARDLQSAQMRAERAELDKLRETWLDKFRREQIVLENGMQFFEQHLSRVSEELRVAQRGLQAVSVSATEANPTAMLIDHELHATNDRPPEPSILSLDEIRERLHELKKPLRSAA